MHPTGTPQFIKQVLTDWKKMREFVPISLFAGQLQFETKKGTKPLPFKWLLVPLHGLVVAREIKTEFSSHLM